MIVTAERHFALNGVESGSLRHIAVAAGQRNESAAQYHFGSREGLLRAILEYRISTINARRERLVEQARLHIARPAAETIASIMVLPMAEEIFANWRQCYWIRFISQLFSISKFRFLADEFEGSSAALFVIYGSLASLPDIHPRILAVRRETLRRDVVWGLSGVEAMSFHASRETCALHVANLVDMIAAGISAAPSANTLAKLNG